jgi:hypothetical protein
MRFLSVWLFACILVYCAAEKSNACINFGINCDESHSPGQLVLPAAPPPIPSGAPSQQVPVEYPPNYLLDIAADPVAGPSAFAPAPRGPVAGVEILTPDESVSFWKGPTKNPVPKAALSVYLVGSIAFAAGLLCGLFCQYVCCCCCRGASRQSPQSSHPQQGMSLCMMVCVRIYVYLCMCMCICMYVCMYQCL